LIADRFQIKIYSKLVIQRFCLTNLLVFLDEVSWNIENSNCMDAIYFDFAKAFDKVPQRIIHKLGSHGISGSLLTWISSCLHCCTAGDKEFRSLELNLNGLRVQVESPKVQC